MLGDNTSYILRNQFFLLKWYRMEATTSVILLLRSFNTCESLFFFSLSGHLPLNCTNSFCFIPLVTIVLEDVFDNVDG